MTDQSAYLTFTRDEWLCYRNDTPLTLSEADLHALHGQMETVSLKEVADIYLPLSRLLSLYVTAMQSLHQATNAFLGKPEPKVPYIIGVAGSVAVGKSLTSRILKALLSRWPNHPAVTVVTTDGFLYPQAHLEKEKLSQRKGFPESYDVNALLQFLIAVKSGQDNLHVPVYSHQLYDIAPNEFLTIQKPDIIILEGLNILQTSIACSQSQPGVFVSDFLDFSIFVDADISVLQQWYVNRVVKFSQTTFRDPHAYFHHVSVWPEKEIRAFAEKIWTDINAVNLVQNILPSRDRAQLILKKDATHAVQMVKLRKL
ncbi:MAG: type I pantothenate kinase [Gammaproteobacteria bacterium RIFCSPLOWO2_02_FULL_42_14]|nr:MAG: type I pantothenate kinase [Gammaproteobacteria bacterium RIFCSPHIGHO2_02_FULL_42_43]OGT28011.1 MAG: type I pantothenate kinase [Gammaproteobacteria bacterium RIFCSPHIGHO2_01_FULL_42_8]OGT52041.1 MAG: type I pantothenate kinase [Gammaproteobacteria bacterium RIFCSPHIGHO2_12_FULL_41_25]OGT61351.1 MAG: type I pantothenate kinase [Gammaproteobacteria bacterium RIFCSPLOWO2_02_FULL_42_14]OGT87280.1 MAG: type I pantothenate kinase [Gammaproteobacteria bacterium RIFCSPLOWO2_12_FULL_42_18]